MVRLAGISLISGRLDPAGDYAARRVPDKGMADWSNRSILLAAFFIAAFFNGPSHSSSSLDLHGFSKREGTMRKLLISVAAAAAVVTFAPVASYAQGVSVDTPVGGVRIGEPRHHY